MLDNGYCENVSEEDINNMTDIIKPMLNVKVNFIQSKEITGKSDSGLASKLSRCFIPKFKNVLYRYSDIIKIRDKII